MRQLLVISALILLLTACEEKPRTFSGYVDTDLVYLSADFGGRLTDLAVIRGQQVSNNQFLFRLEQTQEQYKVKLSEINNVNLFAQRQQILIQLHYNEINYQRTLGMRKQNAASQNDLDASERDYNISQQQLSDIDAKIESNKLDVADRKWQVTRKENFATEQGIIFDTYHTKGEFVQGGAPVLSLVTPGHLKAVFFVPEAVVGQLRLNQRVKMSTDVNPNFAEGHIFYISNIAEYTPPIIYSREERGRLVFRIEAKIDKPSLEKMHLGLPVSLELA